MNLDTRKLGLLCYTFLLGIFMVTKPEIVLHSMESAAVAFAPIVGVITYDMHKYRKFVNGQQLK